MLEQELRIRALRQAVDIVCSDQAYCESVSYDDMVITAINLSENYILPYYLEEYEGLLYAEAECLAGREEHGET